jgi:hypothetical protein
MSMGGRFGKYGDAKHKAQIREKGLERKNYTNVPLFQTKTIGAKSHQGGQGIESRNHSHVKIGDAMDYVE